MKDLERADQLVGERPILFSAPMVRALLDGRKTQTRRVVKSRAGGHCRAWSLGGQWRWLIAETGMHVSEWFRCPYGVPGDRLWVRETWGGDLDFDMPRYRATHDTERRDWKPSIFMPRRISRITLEVTGVRVERLQDISEEDARREGAALAGPQCHEYEDMPTGSYRYGFRTLWDSINVKRAPWASNPWCWCISFRVVTNSTGAAASTDGTDALSTEIQHE